MKQKTKGYIVAVISILFSAFLIVLALALSNLAKGDIRERSQDVEDYRKWSVQEKYTQFLIFPEKIPAEAEEVEYYYQYESGWGRPMSQIYLSYRLDEDTYAKEQERLSSLTYIDRTDETRSVEYDKTSFGYPAYVTIAGYDFCYEYALLNEKEHTIDPDEIPSRSEEMPDRQLRSPQGWRRTERYISCRYFSGRRSVFSGKQYRDRTGTED